MAPRSVGNAGGSVHVTPDGVDAHAHVKIKNPTVKWKSPAGSARKVKKDKPLTAQQRLEFVKKRRAKKTDKPLPKRTIEVVPPRVSIKTTHPKQTEPVNTSPPVVTSGEIKLPSRDDLREAGEPILDRFLEDVVKHTPSKTSSGKNKPNKPSGAKARIRVSTGDHPRRSSKPTKRELPRAFEKALELPTRATEHARNGVKSLADQLKEAKDKLHSPHLRFETSDESDVSSDYDIEEDWDTGSEYSTTTDSSESVSNLSELSDDSGYDTDFDGPLLDEPDREYSIGEQEDALSEASDIASSSTTEDELRAREGDEFPERLEKAESALGKLWGFIKRNKAVILIGVGIFVGVAACVGIGAATGGIGLGLALIAAGGFFLGAGLGIMMAADIKASTPPQQPAETPDNDKSKKESGSPKSEGSTKKTENDDVDESELDSDINDEAQSRLDEEKRRKEKLAKEALLQNAKSGSLPDYDEEGLSATDNDYEAVLSSTVSAKSVPNTISSEVVSPVSVTTTGSIDITPVSASSGQQKSIPKVIPASFSDDDIKTIHGKFSSGKQKFDFLLNAVKADVVIKSSRALTEVDSTELEHALMAEVLGGGVSDVGYKSAAFANKLKGYPFTNKKIGECLAQIEKEASENAARTRSKRK